MGSRGFKAVVGAGQGTGDPQLFPKMTKTMDHAQVINVIELEIGVGKRGDLFTVGFILKQNAFNTADETTKNVGIKLVGTAKVIQDTGLGSLFVLVIKVLGELVIGDDGAIPVVSFGSAQVHAYTMACILLNVTGKSQSRVPMRNEKSKIQA